MIPAVIGASSLLTSSTVTGALSSLAKVGSSFIDSTPFGGPTYEMAEMMYDLVAKTRREKVARGESPALLDIRSVENDIPPAYRELARHGFWMFGGKVSVGPVPGGPAHLYPATSANGAPTLSVTGAMPPATTTVLAANRGELAPASAVSGTVAGVSIPLIALGALVVLWLITQESR